MTDQPSFPSNPTPDPLPEVAGGVIPAPVDPEAPFAAPVPEAAPAAPVPEAAPAAPAWVDPSGESGTVEPDSVIPLPDTSQPIESYPDAPGASGYSTQAEREAVAADSSIAPVDPAYPLTGAQTAASGADANARAHAYLSEVSAYFAVAEQALVAVKDKLSAAMDAIKP